MPLNLASVLYNKTEGAVELLGVNVLGVLYIAEYGGESISSVADLRGQTIYATGRAPCPNTSCAMCCRATASTWTPI